MKRIDFVKSLAALPLLGMAAVDVLAASEFRLPKLSGLITSSNSNLKVECNGFHWHMAVADLENDPCFMIECTGEFVFKLTSDKIVFAEYGVYESVREEFIRILTPGLFQVSILGILEKYAPFGLVSINKIIT